jgi:hypothetical protein
MNNTNLKHIFITKWRFNIDDSEKFKKEFLRPRQITIKNTFSSLLGKELELDYLSLQEVENYFKEVDAGDDLYTFALDFYLFFGECLINEAKSNDNYMSWVYWRYRIPNSSLANYKYQLMGFLGKYKGYDPHIFDLLDQIIEQKKKNIYTNLLSEKFKELAPYTHKKAPKN